MKDPFKLVLTCLTVVLFVAGAVVSAQSGEYPGSTPEARAIIEFAFAHPEIAMTFCFGATNFYYSVPKGGRKSEVDLNNIKIPQSYANMFGADPEKSYSMKEIIDMVQVFVPPGMTVDESMVARFLSLGAVVNPMNEDLVFYNKFKEDYEKFLEEKGPKKERFDPEKAADGSFELWSYYHLGVPVFSMDIWSVPKPEKEKKEGSGLDIDKLEKNLYRVRVRFTISKAMPSVTYKTMKNKLYPGDILKVSGSGIEVVAGGQIQDIYNEKVSFKDHKPEVQFIQVPGFGHVEYEFLVSGKGNVKFEYESRKARNEVTEFQL